MQADYPLEGAQNIMKKILIVIALAVSLPLAFAASNAGEGGHRGHAAHWDRMAESLNLTEEQRAQIRSFFEEQRAEREALRERMHAKMADVLTPEQLQKMEVIRAEHKSKRREKHKRHDCSNQELQSG